MIVVHTQEVAFFSMKGFNSGGFRGLKFLWNFEHLSSLRNVIAFKCETVLERNH